MNTSNKPSTKFLIILVLLIVFVAGSVGYKYGIITGILAQVLISGLAIVLVYCIKQFPKWVQQRSKLKWDQQTKMRQRDKLRKRAQNN